MLNKDKKKSSKKKSSSTSKKSNRAGLIKGKYFRLVIPHLEEYKNYTQDQFMDLKEDVLFFLKQKQKNRDLQYYSIAIQTHSTSGIPHLDILLMYSKSTLSSLNRFDKLIKHGNLTVYRKLNEFILNYNYKEDLHPLTNIPQDKKEIIILNDLQKDPYRFLQLKMLQNPLHFNLDQYVRTNDLAHRISNWSSIKNKLKDMREAEVNLMFRNKPGFKLITRQLIQNTLSKDQLELYDSWSGYQTIVNYLNQIVTFGYKRPLKTMNLLITGVPSIGKSALFQSDLAKTYNCVQNYVSIYPMGTKTWWPNYKPEVYKLILWNEAKLTSYSYDVILKVLDGTKVDLPYKGGSVLKYDNPLVIMLSNRTLDQLIKDKFPNSKSDQLMSKENLKVRIKNVIVPKNKNLFILQKLLLPV